MNKLSQLNSFFWALGWLLSRLAAGKVSLLRSSPEQTSVSIDRPETGGLRRNKKRFVEVHFYGELNPGAWFRGSSPPPLATRKSQNRRDQIFNAPRSSLDQGGLMSQERGMGIYSKPERWPFQSRRQVEASQPATNSKSNQNGCNNRLDINHDQARVQEVALKPTGRKSNQ